MVNVYRISTINCAQLKTTLKFASKWLALIVKASASMMTKLKAIGSTTVKEDKNYIARRNIPGYS